MKTRRVLIAGAVAICIAAVALYFTLGQGRRVRSSKNLAAATEVEVGVILSLTGPGASYGKMVLDGISLGIDEANADGNGMVLRLIVEDDQTEPRVGVEAARKLLALDDVSVILGPIASSVALAVAPLFERSNTIMLSPAASAPALTDAGEYIYRIYPSDTYDGAYLAQVIQGALGIETAAVLYINNDFGLGLNESFTEQFKSEGGEITGHEAFAQGTSDFRSHLTKLGRQDPGALFFVANADEYIAALGQIQDLGLETQVVAPLSFDDPEILRSTGAAAEGVIYSRPRFDKDAEGSVVGTFNSIYRQRYGGDPSILSALGYDSARIIAHAIKAVGPDAAAVKSVLDDMKGFPGAAGDITFDGNGDVNKRLEIVKVVEGQPVEMDEATGDVISN